MKLKYYLRGAGVGIIIAVLIMVIGGSNNRTLSDGEIMRRAMELGMTKVDDGSTKVKDYQPTSAAESSAASQSSAAQSGAASSEASSAASSAAASSTASAESSAASSVASSTSSAVSSRETSSTATTTASAASRAASLDNSAFTTNGDTVTITINTGMLSDKVADMLQSAGVIEDSKDFNKYLIANKYDTQILKGDVTVRKGASYAEIAKLLISKDR